MSVKYRRPNEDTPERPETVVTQTQTFSNYRNGIRNVPPFRNNLIIDMEMERLLEGMQGVYESASRQGGWEEADAYGAVYGDCPY